MPYKDPERQRSYQRNWQRAQRATVQGSTLNLSGDRLQEAQGVLDALSSLMGQLMSAKIDLVMKSRAVAYVASITLRAIETASLETRVEVLEDRILEGEPNGHKPLNPGISKAESKTTAEETKHNGNEEL